MFPVPFVTGWFRRFEAVEVLGSQTAQPRVAPAREKADEAPVRSRRLAPGQPLLSVIIVNYNGGRWLKRCLESLRRQSVAEDIEVLVADSASADGSAELAKGLMEDWPAGRLLQLGANLGYSGGNNRAAAQARGEYLLFLNPDTWLEPDCLERLVEEAQAARAAVATPLVLDYENGAIQSPGAGGFDIFGLTSRAANPSRRQEIFSASGCGLLIQAGWFRKVGGFDGQFFMYADEHDLCWRVWLAGGKVALAPAARLHHRGAVAVNPKGGESMVEIRTSDTKRFYANRNGLLTLLKNSQHVLLLLVLPQALLVGLEALALAAAARRWSHFRRAGLEAMWDCWRLRGHIRAERRRVRALRQHGDLWLLRFLRVRLNRSAELRRCWRLGWPKVDAR